MGFSVMPNIGENPVYSLVARLSCRLHTMFKNRNGAEAKGASLSRVAGWHPSCTIAPRMKHNDQMQLRSPTGGLIMSMRTAYDRELMFEHIIDRVHRERWVEVSFGRYHWRAVLLTPDAKLTCTSCGERLSIAHASADSRLCTRCCKGELH